MEETWWWRKITSPPDDPPISHVWLQMIITLSIFITLIPLVFHNDLKYVKFNLSFMCKSWKWMGDALRMQKIIGHFLNFFQLQQIITQFLEFLNGSSIKMSFKRSNLCYIFGSRSNFDWRTCNFEEHYRSFRSSTLRMFLSTKYSCVFHKFK